ncbi:MAG: winged helix-turn-helix transcriptional regulator [Acidimicrobiales bacterium]
MLGRDYQGQDCSLARALEVIGERWTLLIVRDAFYGVRRFNDFHAHLDIPKAVLSDRLRGLVDDGILEARPDPDHGGRRLYELTACGRALWPVLHALLVWGERHYASNSRDFKHAACGADLDETGSCPACDLTPGPEDVLTTPRSGRARRRDDPVAVALRVPHRLLQPVDT